MRLIRRSSQLFAVAILAGTICMPAADAQNRARSQAAGSSSGAVMYRWVDDDGVPRMGHFLPADQAGRAHEVLNERGIVIRRVPADPVLGDPAEREKARAEQRAAEEAAEEIARRDTMLLNAYLSVEDIEALRDRRLEMMASQIQVTENYLQDLRDRLSRLQREAQRYQPYNENPDAPTIDDRLATELSDTMGSIMLYEQNLAETRKRKSELEREFNADIVRFQELTARQ